MDGRQPALHRVTVTVMILTAFAATFNLIVFASNVHQLVYTGVSSRSNMLIELDSGAVYACFPCNAAEGQWVRWFYQGEPLEIADQLRYESQAGYRYYRVRGRDPSEVMVVESPDSFVVARLSRFGKGEP